jgi:hypothetical protein
VSITQIAESAKEGLLALGVSTGLRDMTVMFDQDMTALCGPDSKHNADRAGYRHGSEAGSVNLESSDNALVLHRPGGLRLGPRQVHDRVRRPLCPRIDLGQHGVPGCE